MSFEDIPDISEMSYTTFELFKKSFFSKFQKDFKTYFDIGTGNKYDFIEWVITLEENNSIKIKESTNTIRNEWGFVNHLADVRISDQKAKLLKYDVETYFFQSMNSVRASIVTHLEENPSNLKTIKTLKRLDVWKKMKGQT